MSRAFTVGSIIGGTRLQALDDVTLSLDGHQPTILSVVGESGSGKTTLARIILRMLEPSAGAVAIDGKPVHDGRRGLTDAEFRRTVQPIFQNPFDTFSGRKPVDTYLYETARNVRGIESRGEATPVVAAALQAVGLDLGIVAGKYAYQFSGGELQRVSVARALIPRPRLIVADEPVSMIDASLRINIVNLFLRLKEEHGISFVYITHDLATAYYVSDQIAIMYRGSVVEHGPLDRVLGAPLHPYTELLLQSVPVFGEKWAGPIGLPDLETREYALAACKFAIAIMYRGSVVEQGPLDRVLGAPLHPYTELLLQSVPVFGEKWAGLIGLPDLETREYARAACKFAPRCPARREVCRAADAAPRCRRGRPQRRSASDPRTTGRPDWRLAQGSDRARSRNASAARSRVSFVTTASRLIMGAASERSARRSA